LDVIDFKCASNFGEAVVEFFCPCIAIPQKKSNVPKKLWRRSQARLGEDYIDLQNEKAGHFQEGEVRNLMANQK
jgi:hypothetical protein